MKIIHTSDWHLGRTLYGRRCHSEFSRFLDWLLLEIEHHQVDCLLVAGDIFDSSTPSNATQSLYYSFLNSVSRGCCRHVIITGGNHDSPSLLNAPRELLSNINVTVIGSAPESMEDEVVLLRNSDGEAELIVCAVPYLRDRDVRSAEPGETYEEKSRKLIHGIAEHYRNVVDIALRKRENHPDIPIIAMGHLFTSGGKVALNNEIRDLYVGSLAHIHSSLFPAEIDYFALGHLHIPQQVSGNERIQYSGSPLQLSFGGDNSGKSITLVTINNQTSIRRVDVPPLLRLHSISGNSEKIFQHLEQLLETQKHTLLEIIYTGDTISTLLQELENKMKGSRVELIRVLHKRPDNVYFSSQEHTETLEDLQEIDVFRRCLTAHSISDEEEIKALENSFIQILRLLEEKDQETNS